MRMNPSFFALSAVVHREHIERSADRPRLLWIERKLKAAFETAECMLRLRVFLADHVVRQLVVLNELHARSVPRTLQEVLV